MTKAAKETRADQAYARLKSEILSNAMPPGSQAMEPELALKFGVSRTTIREALIRLEGEGLIEMIPRRGARVVPILAEDMAEIYQLLVSLESDAAHELALRGISGPDAARLAQANDAMRRALESSDLDGWAAADDDFHRGILDIHGNKRLGRIVSALSDQAHRARLVTRALRPLPAQSLTEHQDILTAICDQDAEKARSLYRDHRVRGAGEIMDILEKLPRL